jgi:hypothetical protein
MDQEIKQQWVDALRSGEYSQGRYWLRHGNRENSNHCCLGVLCDLYDGQLWKQAVDDFTPRYNSDDEDSSEPEDSCFEFDGDASELLPKKVAKWAGFTLDESEYCDGAIRFVGIDDKSRRLVDHLTLIGKSPTLAEVNDQGFSFEEIAEIIEKQF